MSLRRDPFVWEVQVRREVLEDEIARLRDVPYEVWRDTLQREMAKSVTGRDARAYRVKVLAAWAATGSEDIRVTISLQGAGFQRHAISQSFVIAPDNRITE